MYKYMAIFENDEGRFDYELGAARSHEHAEETAITLSEAYGWKFITTYEQFI